LIPVRRLLLLFFLAAFSFLQAQEPAKSDSAQEETNFVWKIVNFALFAGGIGYALVKYGSAFFNARSADIQHAIQEATGLKVNADLRYSEIDRRMANLASEVGKLRAEAQAEMEREHARMIAQTNEDIAYLQRSTAAEIEALSKEGADKLRVHATHEALTLAEARLRERFAASDQKDLIKEFVQLVERGEN
jgi:F-type H+-transporting ATPase subunit b